MTNSSKNKEFDLEERTAKFGEDVIEFCKSVPVGPIHKILISQTVRSATSVGANYCEANGASSRKDFKNKIHICQKEAKETKHWLRMFAKAIPDQSETIRSLWKECHELTLIFGKILSSLKN